MERPSSPACARNRAPILAVLQPWLADRRHVLEIGSGTGEHAVHFAAAMPQLVWQTSDRADYLPGIRAWLDHAQLTNTPPTVTLDVNGRWPQGPFDAVFTANTLHIMGWPEVERLFAALPAVCSPDARLAIYGPFHENGRPTSDSNAAVDAALRARDPRMGLRDRAAVDDLAAASGFKLQRAVPMPSNNLCMLYRRDA
jgi:cyclopropane fatty-acyl-phospholipid synthase-like methyltransferase